ncbi:MAG: hypothetical protein HQL58_03435, partial [Magnetococcales bacterium]|nr:hypothetical protein [Magnetococcales bacterium]
TIVANGSWSIDASVVPDEYSSHTYVRFAMMDSAGNLGLSSDAVALRLDSTPPLVPSDLDLSDDDDDGEFDNDNQTSRTRDLTINGGSGEQDNSITLFDDKNDNSRMDSGEQLIDIRNINGDGYWSGDVTLALGRHNLRAFQTDLAGNISGLSTAFVLRVTSGDTALAAAPVITALAAADDSGSSSSDRITNKTSALTLSGTGQSGQPLVLFQDGNYDDIPDSNEKIATVNLAASSWSTDVALAPGNYQIKAFQIDGEGHNSQVSDPLLLIIDTAVVAPAGLDLADSDDTGPSNSDNITRQSSSLTIQGSSEEENAIVTLFDDKNGNDIVDSGESVGTSTTTGGGWSADISLVAGSHLIKALQVDAAGNRSAISAPLRLTVDTVAPALPSTLDLAAGDDDGASKSDNITSQTSGLTISGGNGDVGSTLIVFDDQTSSGTVGVMDAGEALATISVTATNWSADIDLSLGSHVIKAIQSDLAGNSSGVSSALGLMVVTASVPAVATPTALDLAAADDDGSSSSDNSTSVTSGLTISGGGGTAGNKLVLFDDKNGNDTLDSGEALVTTSVTATSWSADVNLTVGSHVIKAIQSDSAGRSSRASDPLAMVIVSVSSANALVTPSGLDLDSADDDGSSSSDNITSKSSALTIRGSGGVKGAKLVLFDDQDNDGVVDSGEALTTVSVTAASWSADINLAVGSHAVKAMQKGVTGKSDSSASSALAVVVVTVSAPVLAAPAALDLAAADDSGKSASDNITKNSKALSISGTGEKKAVVTLFDDVNNNGQLDQGELLLGSVTTTSNKWSKDIVLAAGSHSVRAIQKVGTSVSSASNALMITVDITGPGALSIPDLDAADDDGTDNSNNITSVTKGLNFSGNGGEIGATVTLFVDKNKNKKQDSSEKALTTMTVGSDGSWRSTDMAMAIGTYSLMAFQTDLAGNAGPMSGALNLSIVKSTDKRRSLATAPLAALSSPVVMMGDTSQPLWPGVLTGNA